MKQMGRDFVRFKCEIEKITTLKKGAKLILAIPDEQTITVLKNIYDFIYKPVEVEILVDEERQKERLLQISENQRKKIYKLIRDIANYYESRVDSTKEIMKLEFIRERQWDDFSLSNCSSKLASDFIEWLIDFCFENGIPLSEKPSEILDDIEKYVRLCLKHKICAICGQTGEIHHWDAIGRWRERTRTDHWRLRKICLCRKHHTEARQMGINAFEDKYHVYGIVWVRDDEIHKN